MDPTTLKVALAGLIHDIGKFADRECLQLEGQDIDASEEQLYLPVSNGRFTHYHALYTACFLKRFRSELPLELQQDFWGEGDPFVNLAAGHHKPSTALQWVVAVADRVSSGWDRDNFDKNVQSAVPWKDYKRTRMIPIFEQLSLSPDQNKTLEWAGRYALAPVSPDSIFPVPADRLAPADNLQAQAEYRRLFDQFCTGLQNLKDRDRIDLWCEHFDSLLMSHTTAIPAARAGSVIPDVSLYDHCRATAALAPAIYLYHRDHQSLTDREVQSYTDPKFLLVQGDFQGIQKFIFSRTGESQRYRSKLLRGRSFAVSLMSELAADLLCQKMGLPFTSVWLNAAGKFTIIAPNTDGAKTAVASAKKEINDWLTGKTFGEARILITFQAATCDDLVSGRFCTLWDRLCDKAEETKYAGFDFDAYGGVVEGYLDGFHNIPGRPAICPICGKRPSLRNPGAYLGDDQAACALCRDHIFMGTGLVKYDQLAVWESADAISGREKGLFEPLFGKYQIGFTDSTEDIQEGRSALRHFWQWRISENGGRPSGIAQKFISGYLPRYTDDDLENPTIRNRTDKADEFECKAGDPMTLNHIALFALTPGEKGTEALGVLKADVDYLGALMACGMEEKRYTLSRLAALSRQLNWFFSLYLPDYLSKSEDFRTTYTVFAGGDDLFFIGPWNKMLELAMDIESAFEKYVCSNPDVHLSAGLSMHKSHTPIHKLAEASEAALETSKSSGRNCFTVFGETVLWKKLRELNDIRKQMEHWLDQGYMSRVFFYHINDFVDMAGREQRLQSGRELYLKDMACTKWRAYLAYAAERNLAGKFKGDQRKEKVKNINVQLADWLTRFGSSLKIPVWTILYNRR